MHTSLYSVCSEAIRILNVNSVPESSIVNPLARNGIATIQKLKETDIDQISNFRCIGSIRLGIILKMKDIVEYEPTELENVCELVYVYSLLNDKFSSHEGVIAIAPNSNFGVFRSKDNYHGTVSMIPGEIYNGVLWLPAKNDKEARKLFITHYTNKNESLKRQLENNIKKLRILENNLQ